MMTGNRYTCSASPLAAAIANFPPPTTSVGCAAGPVISPPPGHHTAQPSHPPGLAYPFLLSSVLHQGVDFPEKKTQRLRRTRANTVRLATHLQTLEQHDSKRVIVAKRIARLGLCNGEVLRKHFETYGPVTDVFLANPPPDAFSEINESIHRRFRPSGMAHILMDNAEDVEKIFAEGDEVMVDGVAVLVSRFWRRAAVDTLGDGAGDEGIAISL